MSADSVEANVIPAGTRADELKGVAEPVPNPVAVSELQTPSNSLLKIVRRLDQAGLDYCVLTWIQEEPVQEAVIVVTREQAGLLRRVLSAVTVPGYQLVRRGAGEFDTYCWEWAGISTQLELLRITAVFEVRKGGRLALSAEQVMSRRQPGEEYWAAGAEDEFRFLLVRVAAGRVSVPVYSRLRTLIQMLGNKAVLLAAEILGNRQATRVVNAFSGSDGAALSLEKTPGISLRALAHPIRLARYLGVVASRRVWRWRNPAGLFVVMLGPDGVGKSTTRRELVKFLRPLFDSYGVWHFRPRVIGRVGPGRPVGAPHSMPARGPVMSVLYLMTLVLDCWLGYLWSIRPLLVRSSLVILDRYFYDLLVDAKRYRYGGPKWLAVLLRRFVPPQNVMFLVLDADAAVIYSRKRELPFDEIVRQRASYNEWAATHCNSVRVRTDAAVEQVVIEAARGIVNYLASRLTREETKPGNPAIVNLQFVD